MQVIKPRLWVKLAWCFVVIRPLAPKIVIAQVENHTNWPKYNHKLQNQGLLSKPRLTFWLQATFDVGNTVQNLLCSKVDAGAQARVGAQPRFKGKRPRASAWAQTSSDRRF